MCNIEYMEPCFPRHIWDAEEIEPGQAGRFGGSAMPPGLRFPWSAVRPSKGRAPFLHSGTCSTRRDAHLAGTGLLAPSDTVSMLQKHKFFGNKIGTEPHTGFPPHARLRARRPTLPMLTAVISAHARSALVLRRREFFNRRSHRSTSRNTESFFWSWIFGRANAPCID